MPATLHEPMGHQPPEGEGNFVWRYMDLARFISLLSTSNLFFSRPDQFEDPFEGFVRNDLPPPLSKLRLTILGKKSQAYPFVDLVKYLNKWRYVNCWHLNEFESAAMWKLYGKNDESIAIKSSYQKLANCLIPQVEIGMVRYLDYNKQWFPLLTSTSSSLMFKRKSFAHENEVRLIAYHSELPVTEDGEPDFEKVNHCIGSTFKIDLNELIEDIYISPYAPTWFLDVIKSIVGKYELNENIKVIQSDLFKLPV